MSKVQVTALQSKNDPNVYEVGMFSATGGDFQAWGMFPADFFIELGFWEGKNPNPQHIVFGIERTS